MACSVFREQQTEIMQDGGRCANGGDPFFFTGLFQQDVKQGPAPKEGPDLSKPYFVDFGKNGKKPIIAPNTWGRLRP